MKRFFAVYRINSTNRNKFSEKLLQAYYDKYGENAKVDAIVIEDNDKYRFYKYNNIGGLVFLMELYNAYNAGYYNSCGE